jgi:hypothetical protein
MYPARSGDHGGIGRTEIRPWPRKSPELSCIVVKEDAVLAPRLAAFDQLEDAPM